MKKDYPFHVMKVIIHVMRGGNYMQSKNILGQRIKKLRKELKLNQQDVAEKLNISVAALSRYETGAFEPKSTALIVDLAFLYNVSTDYILGKSDARNPEVDFDKLDIGLSSKTYETLTPHQKKQSKRLITVIISDED